MKKLFSLTLCLSLFTSILTGCSGTSEQTQTTQKNQQTNQSQKSETSSEKQVEISMFISMPEYTDAINQLIEAYKKEKPNVTINYETTQNDYPTLLKTKLNSGECPDIFSSTSGKEIAVYLDYSKDLSNDPLAQSMTDSVKNVMKSGNEIHGMAIKDNIFGIVYNKEIFEKAGITEFPQTFKDLEAACEKIKAIGVTPFSTGFAEWWVYKHVFQHYLNAAKPDDPPSLVSDFINGKAHFKDYPALYDDFFKFIDLAVKYGDSKPLETDLSAELAALGGGKAAMICGQGPWVETDLLKIDPNLKIALDGYPVNDDASLTRVIAGADQALRIYKDSEHLDEVLAFCNWWYTSDYGKKWFSEVAGVIPPVKGVERPKSQIVESGFALVDKEGAGIPAIVYSTDSFHQAFGEIMQSYVAKTLTKDQVCEHIEQKWVELEKAQ